ncbi:hypothetical protein DFH11DRAFT_1540006 [Phellopilus nigrolimitatus]|nr:hypothetical protein DFH11DRAFT_1540006 [Phellopilus nigrolimitatus]
MLLLKEEIDGFGMTPDERTPFIPLGEDGPSTSTYDATTIDHQKAKDRLHVIVKSKEGPPNEQILSRHSSPKPSPSISRSESASSMHQASVSRVSTSEDMADPYIEHKLKVHLVPTAKSNQRVFSRRGRSKTRQGRLVEDGELSVNAPTLEGIQSVDSGRGDFDSAESHLLARNEVLDSLPGVSDIDRPDVTPLSDEDNAAIKAVSNDLSATLRDTFEDVGTLTRSWGD